MCGKPGSVESARSVACDRARQVDGESSVEWSLRAVSKPVKSHNAAIAFGFSLAKPANFWTFDVVSSGDKVLQMPEAFARRFRVEDKARALFVTVTRATA